MKDEKTSDMSGREETSKTPPRVYRELNHQLVCEDFDLKI